MLTKLFSFARSFEWRSRRGKQTIALSAALIVVLLIIGRSLGGDAQTEEYSKKRFVDISRVEDLMGGGRSLIIVGNVESINEAAVRSETGGKVVRVRASLGDRVSAGQTLAELENSSQRAALLQAEGALEAAQAALTKIKEGTRSEQLSIREASLESAKGAAVSSLLSAYASVNSAVEDTADQMFTNVELNQPSFTVFTSNGQREIQLEQMRKQLAVLLARESLQATTISKNSDLKSEMQKTENELREVRNFIDLLLAALADAIPNDDTPAATIASYKSDATSARTSLTTSLSGVSSALASLETAEKNLEEGVAGAVDADIAATEASVKQAQGAYNAALASLEKTILRSPIAGTLNTFDIKLGDYLQPSQQIALVSNNGALQVIAYIGEKDRPNVSPGDAAIIEGKYPGTVTKIAPALDPVTRRIEMRIGLSPEAATHLTNGQSVRIAFPRKETAASSEDILIPITALKLETDRIVAFKVENGRIVALPITIGTISGSMVRVEEGLALDTEIVADARGLKEGDEVEISIAE